MIKLFTKSFQIVLCLSNFTFTYQDCSRTIFIGNKNKNCWAGSGQTLLVVVRLNSSFTVLISLIKQYCTMYSTVCKHVYVDLSHLYSTTYAICLLNNNVNVLLRDVYVVLYHLYCYVLYCTVQACVWICVICTAVY